MRCLAILGSMWIFASSLQADEKDWFFLRVTDADTGHAVPLVTLKTTNHLAFITDSDGAVALNEPDLMDNEVFFHISSPGYEVAKDGFGYAGVRLTPKAGERHDLKIRRTQIAERVCRLTGEGIYRDSILLGQKVPATAYPRAGVTGQDSVQAVPWRGRLFWLWGDTNLLRYPLGNFHTTCAWSPPPEADSGGSRDPAWEAEYDYLRDADGSPRQMLPMKEPGPVWIFGLLTVADQAGTDHLLGHYGRFERLDKRVEHGLTEFDEKEGRFAKLRVLGDDITWQHPDGNAVRVKSADGAGDFYHFTEAFPVVRVPARYEAIQDTASYEALAWDAAQGRHVWQKEKPPLTQAAEAALIREGKLPAERALLQVQDATTGKPVTIHRACVNWNAYRKAWIMIATQQGGDVSHLGEVWYAEAAAPEGPWKKAVKVATHPKYSFYNPRQHTFWDDAGGRVIYFEGTYTESFSGNPVATPRYDYNQMLYRLDLGDERLAKVR